MKNQMAQSPQDQSQTILRLERCATYWVYLVGAEGWLSWFCGGFGGEKKVERRKGGLASWWTRSIQHLYVLVSNELYYTSDYDIIEFDLLIQVRNYIFLIFLITD